MRDTTPGSPEHIKRYQYNYENEWGQHNFHFQKIPFASQAHHMIPNEVFSSRENRFTEDEMTILRMVPYNLNHGANIIFLPYDYRNCVIHNLPRHNGSHPAYNNKAFKDIKRVKNDMNKVNSEGCATVEMPKNVLKSFRDTQDELWDWILKQGAGNINEHAKASARTTRRV